MKSYLTYIPLAAALMCVGYYVVFTVEMPMNSDVIALKDRVGVALSLLWLTPFTLAGSWYWTVPAILLVAFVLMLAYTKLPERVTSWRPRGVVQSVLVYVPLGYGLLAALLLAVFLVFAIPIAVFGS